MTAGLEDEVEKGRRATESVAFEGGPIIGHVRLTPEDFSSIWAALPQNRQVFMRFGLWFCAIPLFVVVHAALNSSSSPEPYSFPWIVIAAPILMAGALIFGLRRGRATWAKNAVADLRGTEGVDFRFDAQGFSLNAPGRQVQQEWSSLYRCIELPHTFALYTAPAMVMAVPKRAFAEADQARLHTCLSKLVPNRPLRGAGGGKPIVRALLLWVLLIFVFLAIWKFLDAK